MGRKIAKIARLKSPSFTNRRSPSLGVTPCEFIDESYLARSSWGYQIVKKSWR